MELPRGFNYSGNIPTPQELGVKGTGSMKQMRQNVSALLDYGTILSDGCNQSGGCPGASKELEDAANAARADIEKGGFQNRVEGFNIHPLGDKYFLKTSAKCKDLKGGEQDRYIYINNEPTGKIRLGFGTVGRGGAGSMRGLIPSLVEDMGKLNPLELMRSFSAGNSKCKEVELETIDSNGKKSRAKHYMMLDDIVDLDPFVGSRGEFVKFNKKLRTGSEDIVVPSAGINKFENVYIFGFSVFVIFLISKMAYK